MKVTVELDPRIVWRIQDEAERQGITPGDVLRAELTPRTGTIPAAQRIREMHATGMCDADMAEQLRYLPGTIANIRRDMGLPANRRYRRAA